MPEDDRDRDGSEQVRSRSREIEAPPEGVLSGENDARYAGEE